ncbi:hypothetical protein ACIF9R_32985 [Streptomyces sp. NPDC086080]|uniref:hypothetical protein n=1 Tax=Streptomyces sp. NPDC086080 TaxID=3365748 RepID=UPI0037D75A2E
MAQDDARSAPHSAPAASARTLLSALVPALPAGGHGDESSPPRARPPCIASLPARPLVTGRPQTRLRTDGTAVR